MGLLDQVVTSLNSLDIFGQVVTLVLDFFGSFMSSSDSSLKI